MDQNPSWIAKALLILTAAVMPMPNTWRSSRWPECGLSIGKGGRAVLMTEASCNGNSLLSDAGGGAGGSVLYWC